jgi:hypothetical protein
VFPTHAEASDESLRHHLVVDRRFTDDGAKRFIEAFRSTLALANIGTAGIMSEQTPVAPRASVITSTGQSTTPIEGAESILLPLGSKKVRLEVPLPVSEQEWLLMMGILQAMKPGIVSNSEAAFEPVAQTAEPQPTPEEKAEALLQTIDEGGLPTQMTSNLLDVALENGVSASPYSDPAKVVADLRARIDSEV